MAMTSDSVKSLTQARNDASTFVGGPGDSLDAYWDSSPVQSAMSWRIRNVFYCQQLARTKLATW